MACINCSCSPPKTGSTYQICTNAAAQRLPGVPDSALQNYCATAGASSSNFTMCLAMACMIARRLIYYKCSPGDCGSPGFALTNVGSKITAGAASALGTAASADPEPISQGILAGMAAIFGGFSAAHAAAVQTEQQTICQVAVNYNQAVQELEQAVEQGVMSPSAASSVLDQITQQLDSVLAGIAKPCNASCGFRITLRALNLYFDDMVFSELAPLVIVPGVTAVTAPPPVSSAAAPGTTGPVGSPISIVPPPAVPPLPPNVGNYQGASGYVPQPLNANNAGVGATATIAATGLPSSIPWGAVVLIGGVAYIASRPGAAA